MSTYHDGQMRDAALEADRQAHRSEGTIWDHGMTERLRLALDRYRAAKLADNGTYPWKLKLDALAVDVAEAALEAGI